MLLYSLAGFAQSPAESIVAKAKTIKTLTAEFEQRKSIASLSQPAVSKGNIYFSSPNKMRWQQNSPSPFLMVFTGENATIKVGASPVQEFNASSNRMFKELSTIILGGITGELFEEKKNYDITFTAINGATKATLIPQNKQVRRYISSIEMIFNKDWVAEQIILNEGNGNKTIIIFSAIRINDSIADNQYILR